MASWAARVLNGLDDNEAAVNKFVEAQQVKLTNIEAQVAAEAKARQEAVQQGVDLAPRSL